MIAGFRGIVNVNVTISDERPWKRKSLAVSSTDFTIVIDLVEEESNFFYLSSKEYTVPPNLLDW